MAKQTKERLHLSLLAAVEGLEGRPAIEAIHAWLRDNLGHLDERERYGLDALASLDVADYPVEQSRLSIHDVTALARLGPPRAWSDLCAGIHRVLEAGLTVEQPVAEPCCGLGRQWMEEERSALPLLECTVCGSTEWPRGKPAEPWRVRIPTTAYLRTIGVLEG